MVCLMDAQSALPSVAVKVLDPGIDPPSRAHASDAGVDLRSTVDVVVPPGQRRVVPTGVAVAIPVGWAGLVCPRSGLAAKEGVTITNAPGVVDSDYRGEVMVILQATDREVTVRRGDRIAQMVVVPCLLGAWEHVDELDDTERGAGGHGSTGR
jgi:dUTP pyrophosphatase